MAERATPGDEIGTHPTPRGLEPDAHGQAALLLSESILHTLLHAKVLTLGEATDAVRSACEVKVEVAEESGESDGRMRHSLALLAAIEHSMASNGIAAAHEL